MAAIAAITTALFLLRPHLLDAEADANTGLRVLSLSLVHRDSIHSPSYPGPLTDLQRLQRTISFSRFPVDNNATSSDVVPLDDDTDICGIAPYVSYGGFYLVTFGMGTPLKVFSLVLDTGSDLTWTQCFPSNPQFQQAHPMFDPAGSSSFRYVNPQYHGCELPSRPSGQYCRYDMRYESGEITSGALALDTFHFYALDADDGILSFPDLTFGCSHASVGANFYPTQNGVLGMGAGPLSLATQLERYYGGRFSYCLFYPLPGSGPSRLLFGNDIHMVGDVQTTPFLATDSPSHYYLSLEDITLSGLSLGLNADVYKPDDLLQRGTAIDSGAVGFLYDPAFDALKEIISAFFGLYDYTPFDMSTITSTTRLEICYEDTKPSSVWEDMFLTFRFQGPALLDVPPKYLFSRVADHQPPFFCLSMFRNNRLTLIGYWQQMDVRFTYDLVQGVLQFVPESCDPSSSAEN